MCLPTLVIGSDGLAFHCWTFAGPSHNNGYRSPSSAKRTRSTTSWHSPKHAQSVSYGGSRRSSQDAVRLERVAAGGSHTHQQLMEKQNGDRDTETIRKCGSVHHAGSPDWISYRSNRLLAIGQLLVARTRGTSSHSSLTKTETTSESSDTHQHRERLFHDTITTVESIQSGEQLAIGRG
ncbi:hypothetical protein JTB14_004866 [Gonioctena quinquepunctata]|nr:hypothetical protein JTB14_004866 [Gonioctena quinquepunctata]